VGNEEKIGKIELKGNQVSAKQIYEAVEKEVGRIRVLYEIRPLLETRPLKKNGPELFKAGEEVELKIQIQWPRGIRRYCEDHFLEIKLGSSTNDRCDCNRYNIANEEEVMCHTCSLMKRVCCVCQKPVDVEEEEEAVKDECDMYDIEIPEGIFPLDFSWLHRNEDNYRIQNNK
jgi:hypothetical protein